MTDDTTMRPPGSETIETSLDFKPQFGRDGLIPAIATDHKTGIVLMFAHMNADALRMTLESGVAHFWSRSRAKIWKKGEESGNLLRVAEVRTDCDQDVLWLIVDVEGKGVACHTGEVSCFYRRIVPAGGTAGATVLERAELPQPREKR